jgi:hypothetical protein
MLNVLGRRNSSNVQKVLSVCDELHLSYEREDIGGAFGHNQSAKYLAMSPNGTVPTLTISGEPFGNLTLLCATYVKVVSHMACCRRMSGRSPWRSNGWTGNKPFLPGDSPSFLESDQN